MKSKKNKESPQNEPEPKRQKPQKDGDKGGFDILRAVLIAAAAGIAVFEAIFITGIYMGYRYNDTIASSAPTYSQAQTVQPSQTPDVSRSVNTGPPQSSQAISPSDDEKEQGYSNNQSETDQPSPSESVSPEPPAQPETSEPPKSPAQPESPIQTPSSDPSATNSTQQAENTTNRAVVTSSPSPEVSNEPSAAPADTKTPEQNSPSAQSGNQGGSSTSYQRTDWPQGKFLGSSESDKYHSYNCRAAARILPENEIWFDSEEEAQAAHYSRCGICW